MPNDFQHNNGVFYSSKPSESLVRESRVAAITKKNFDVMAVYLAVRHSMESTWLNDRDQFLFPNDARKADVVFQTDCLVYALKCNFKHRHIAHWNVVNTSVKHLAL